MRRAARFIVVVAMVAILVFYVKMAEPKVHSVVIGPNYQVLLPGDSLQLIASVYADAGVATTVSWSSQDSTRAIVSQSGKVSVPTGAGYGPVKVIARSTTNGKVAGEVLLYVDPEFSKRVSHH